jgi:hypothetical protein
MPGATTMGLMSQTPRFMRRKLILIALAPATGMLVTQAVAMAGPRRVSWIIAALLLYFVYVAIFIVFVRRATARWRKRLADADFRLCFRCGYDISALAPDGVCPECGEAYIGESLRIRWRGAGFSPAHTDRA